MDIEQLQIVLSVQAEGVQNQINSVISQLNGLNSVVSKTSLGMAGSMNGAFANMAIGSLLGASIRQGMNQATQAIKAEMSQISNAMKSGMQAASASSQASMAQMTTAMTAATQGISRELAKIADNKVEIKVDTDQAQAAVKDLHEQIRKSGKESSFNTGPEGTSFFGTSRQGYEGLGGLMFMAPGEGAPSQAPGNGSGPTPGGIAGRYDSDDDVPAINILTAVSREMSARMQSINATLIRQYASSDMDGDGPTSRENSLNTRMENHLADIKADVNAIRLKMSTDNNGSGGAAGVAAAGGAVKGGMAGIAMGFSSVMAIIAAVAAAAYVVGDSIKSAMDAIESDSMFGAVFGDKTGSMTQWSEGVGTGGSAMYNTGAQAGQKAGQDLGLNPIAIRENTAMMYAMTSSMGMASGPAQALSQDMAMLANDMASFYNLKPDEAFDKLRSGISGESEPLKRLGIIVNENTTKSYAYANGIAAQGSALNEAQKAAARYGLIMQSTATAQGDLARTINSPANQLRVLVTNLQMLKINLGNAFMPIVTVALPIMNAFVRGLSVVMGYVAAFNRTLFGTGAATAASAANAKVASSLGDVAKQTGAASAAAEKAKGSLAGFDEINQLNYNPGGASGGGGGAIGGGGIAIPDIMPAGNGAVSGFTAISESIQKKIDEMVAKIKPSLNQIGENFLALWNNPSLQGAIEDIGEIIGNVMVIGIRLFGDFSDLINPEKNPAMKYLLAGVEVVTGALSWLFEKMAGDWYPTVMQFAAIWAGLSVGNALVAAFTALQLAMAPIMVTLTGIATAVAAFFGISVGVLLGIVAAVVAAGVLIYVYWDEIVAFFQAAWESIKEFAAAAWEGIVAVWDVCVQWFTDVFDSVLAVIDEFWIWLSKAAQDAWEYVKGQWDKAIKFYVDLFAAITSTLDKFWKWLSKIASDVWEGLKSAWNNATAFFSGLWQGIKDMATIFWDWLSDIISFVWDGLVSIWTNALEFYSGLWNGIKDAALIFWTWLQDTVGAVWDALVNVWEQAIEFYAGIWDAVWTSADSFWSWLGGIGVAVWEGIKDVWDGVIGFYGSIWTGVKTAGLLFWDWLGNIGSGAWTAIKTVWDNAGTFFSGVWDSITKVFKDVKTWFSGIFDDAWDGVTGAFSSVGTFFGGIWDTIQSKFVDIGTKIGDAVGDSFKSVINGVLSTIENVVNGFIKKINSAIDVINYIPGVEISKVKTVSIPRLAQGGIVSKPTIAQIGEAGAEMVVPLENTPFVTKQAEAMGRAVKEAVKEALAESSSKSSGDLVLQIDGTTFGRVAIDKINTVQRQAGKTLLVSR